MRDHLERVARPAQVIVDAELDEGTAVLGGAHGQLATVKPQVPEDRAVELRACGTLTHGAGERDAQHRPAGVRLPQVKTGQRHRPELAPGFLAGLAYHGLDQRFAGLDVAGRLVEDHAPRRALLHEKEAPAVLGDGRDGEVELEGHRCDYTGGVALLRSAVATATWRVLRVNRFRGAAGASRLPARWRSRSRRSS